MNRYDKIPAILHSTLQNWEIPIITPSSILPDFLRPQLDPTSWPYELHYALYTLSGLTFRNKERAWRLLETYHTARLREARQKLGNACENTALQVRDVEEACKSARKMLPGMQMQEALGRKPRQGEWQRGMPRRTESGVFDLPGAMEMGVGLGMQLDMPVDVSTQMELPPTTQCDMISNAEIDHAFELELQKLGQDSMFSVGEDGDKTPVPGHAAFPMQAQTSASPSPSPSLSFLDTNTGATPRAPFISSEPFSPLSIFSLSDFSTSPITPATYTTSPEQLPTDSRPVLPQLITQDLPTIYEASESEEMDALRLEFERLEKECEDARIKYWGAMGRSGDV